MRSHECVRRLQRGRRLTRGLQRARQAQRCLPPRRLQLQRTQAVLHCGGGIPRALLHTNSDAAGATRRAFYRHLRQVMEKADIILEVLDARAYAVFPDSSFSSETMTGSLRVRRDIWLMLSDPSSSASARQS